MIKKKKERKKEKEKLLSPSINKEFESTELFVCVCVLIFTWGKIRTAAWEAASQIALTDCSKAAVGERQYIRFW